MEESLENVDTISCKDDIQARNEMLAKKIEELENEKKKNQEEFGQQRAKMKDLFLSKEEKLRNLSSQVKSLQSDLDEARSQITVAELSLQSRLEENKRRYEEEISSLQRLVTEHFNGEDATVGYEQVNPSLHTTGPVPPQPTAYEVENLRKINEKLVTEITHLKSLVPPSSGSSSYEPLLTAPTAMFNTLKKLSTNVATSASSNLSGALSGGGSSSMLPSGDSLEEEKRKAEEDAEVLRSLVVPLEDEIKLLKQMLRSTDEELRKYKKQVQGSATTPHSLLQDCVFDSCDLDISEPSQQSQLTEDTSVDLVSINSATSSIHNQPSRLRHSQSSNKSTDLSPSHHSLDSIKPCDQCSLHKQSLKESQDRIKDLEKQVNSLEKVKEELHRESVFRREMETLWSEKKELHKSQVSELTQKCTRVENELRELRDTYGHTFDGVRRQVQRLEDERRQCQTRIEEVQRKNDALVGKTSKCSAELQDEFIDLPSSIETLHELILGLRHDLIRARVGKEDAEERVGVLETEAIQMSTVQAQLNSLKAELDRARDDRKSLQAHLRQKNMKIVNLQKELDNYEKNQKDFVLLSQSLQQTLENNNASNEVRLCTAQPILAADSGE
uniref:Rab GTPase-binding effector protein 1 n=1 Tax=Cacopsylla melanoneura TaxID=428564 RepID=A0A8D8W7W6_9HEMI